MCSQAVSPTLPPGKHNVGVRWTCHSDSAFARLLWSLFDVVNLAVWCAGYENEVGESFHALVHVNWVHFSYIVSSSYVCADSASEGSNVTKVVASDVFCYRLAG